MGESIVELLDFNGFAKAKRFLNFLCLMNAINYETYVNTMDQLMTVYYQQSSQEIS